MPARRILRLARTRRWAMVASGTRKALAICGVVSPPSVRSVSATRASGASAGWQQVNISRRRSSGTALMSVTSPPPPLPPGPVDGLAPGGREQPGPRPVGHTRPGPVLEGGDVGLLQRLLGEV